MPREFLKIHITVLHGQLALPTIDIRAAAVLVLFFHYIIRTCLHQQILSTFFCVNIFYLFFIKFSVFPVDRFSLRPALVQLRLR